MTDRESLQKFKADLHIHTVLSPCGSLEMSPSNIIKEASRKKLDIIGITDHNASQHGPLCRKLAKDYGIFVLMGLEVTTIEEVHCLVFFETEEILNIFQEYIDSHIKKIQNNPDKFGFQVIVDEHENITGQVDWLLINATDLTLDSVEEKVHQLGGIFIPAHIDRSAFSLISQLGFVPPDLKADAYEVSKFSSEHAMIKKFPWLDGKAFISSSDAHFLKDIGCSVTEFNIIDCNFDEIRKAFQGLEGRNVRTILK
jgi:hypothetical protein